MDKLKTALHESGHAVAHIRLDIQQDDMTIIPDGIAYGAVSSEGINHVTNAEDAHDMVQAYCAGYASLIAHGYSNERALVGCDDDFEKAFELIESWDLKLNLERYKALTVELMSQPMNLDAVKLLADYVLKRERVAGDVIEVLVELSDGDCTKAEFDRFMAMRTACPWER
jgi:hypothetical protein